MRAQPHLTPLLALLLKSFGIPVLIHGVLEGGGGTAAAYVLRELGIMPSTTAAQVNAGLRDDGIAFAPVALLSPGLASLLALRSRLGIDGWVTRLAALADVLGERSVRVTPVASGAEMASTRVVLEALGGHALLLQGCEGEAFADPLQRPDMVLVQDGQGQHVYEAQSTSSAPANLPAPDARATGAWIDQVMRDHLPLPLAHPQSTGGVPLCRRIYRRPQPGACHHRDQRVWPGGGVGFGARRTIRHRDGAWCCGGSWRRLNKP